MRPALAALLLLAACDPSDTDKVGSDSGDEPTVGDAAVSDVTYELATIVTVVIVRWNTDVAATGYVEFGPDETYGTATNTTASGTAHEVFLVGTAADTLVHFRVVVDTGSGPKPTSDYSITTGPLPTGTPHPVVSGSMSDEWQFMVLPTQGAVPAVTIVNQLGEVVWYYRPMVEGGNLMRALLTADRKAVLLGHAGTQGKLEDSQLQYISIDGGTVRDIPTPYFDHDLDELPDGTVAMISVERRTRPNGTPWEADRIVELALDGTETVIWNAWESLDSTPYENEMAPNWTHANGLDYWAEEDAYLISLKTIGTLCKVNRSTGEIEWMVDGQLNEFDFGDDEIVQLQHQFEMMPNGNLLLFDNGTPERGYSRAVELDLDIDARTATQVWEYIRTPPLVVFAKGDVQRFDNGNTLVTWSPNGEIQLVTPDGLPTWQLNAELGQGFTFVHPVDSFYDVP